MEIKEYYNILRLTESASDEEVSTAYKRLALKYHPDKNPDRIEWANDAMSSLNLAYATIMSHRFNKSVPEKPAESKKPTKPKTQTRPSEPIRDFMDIDELTNRFINLRETAKDYLYQYFQYSLYRITLRESASNSTLFARIVSVLKKTYHGINDLSSRTHDSETLLHFKVFRAMLFHFYKASECLTINDSYNNTYDIEAYRLYRRGDDVLHKAEMELFFDRHNRGSFKKDLTSSLLRESERQFEGALRLFPKSTWAVEIEIKLEYNRALKGYLELFFTD
jgi:curved DNA-binding protein CbpA